MKNHLTRKINLVAGLIASLLALNCLAEVAQAASASPKPLTYESSLSNFKSINNDTAKQSASDSTNETQDIPSMDHSKMSPEEMKNMDHGKIKPDEMKDMKGMDHSKMSPEEMKKMDHSKMTPDEMKNMKAAPEKSAKPSKVKKLKPMPLPKKPKPASEVNPTEVKPEAPANPHQNHQM